MLLTGSVRVEQRSNQRGTRLLELFPPYKKKKEFFIFYLFISKGTRLGVSRNVFIDRTIQGKAWRHPLVWFVFWLLVQHFGIPDARGYLWLDG